jgi:hypothetical protein
MIVYISSKGDTWIITSVIGHRYLALCFHSCGSGHCLILSSLASNAQISIQFSMEDHWHHSCRRNPKHYFEFGCYPGGHSFSMRRVATSFRENEAQPKAVFHEHVARSNVFWLPSSKTLNTKFLLNFSSIYPTRPLNTLFHSLRLPPVLQGAAQIMKRRSRGRAANSTDSRTNHSGQ